MNQRFQAPSSPKRRLGLGLLALVLVPLLLLLHAPVLAAVVPGAILTVASLEAIDSREAELSLPTVEIVDPGDVRELARLGGATLVPSQSRRVDV